MESSSLILSKTKNNLKRLALEILAMGIVGLSGYNILQSYLKHKKGLRRIKIIIFDNEEIGFFKK